MTLARPTLLLGLLMVLSACTTNPPEGIYAHGKNPIFRFPDTVGVPVIAEKNEYAPNDLNVSAPGVTQEAWLKKHGYEYVRYELSERPTEIVQDAQGGDADVIVVNRLYARAE